MNVMMMDSGEGGAGTMERKEEREKEEALHPEGGGFIQYLS